MQLEVRETLTSFDAMGAFPWALLYEMLRLKEQLLSACWSHAGCILEDAPPTAAQPLRSRTSAT